MVGIIFGIWMVIFGISLTATGIGALAGIPVILASVLSPFFLGACFGLLGMVPHKKVNAGTPR